MYAFESPFKPALEIMPVVDGIVGPATHKIYGTACFGGCIELCCDSRFEVQDAKGAPAGRIVKL